MAVDRRKPTQLGFMTIQSTAQCILTRCLVPELGSLLTHYGFQPRGPFFQRVTPTLQGDEAIVA